MELGERQVEVPWLTRKLQIYKGSCLDIGSGGTDLDEIMRQKRELVRVDPRELPNDNYSKAMIAKDIRDITPQEIGTFDNVILISTLEHIGCAGYGLPESYTLGGKDIVEEQKLTFNHCLSFCNPKGRLITTVPFGAYENGGWYFVYDADMIDALLFDKHVLAEDYFSLDPDTWTYNRKQREYIPKRQADWIRPDFARAYGVACFVVTRKQEEI